jgi:hypothetical protein
MRFRLMLRTISALLLLVYNDGAVAGTACYVSTCKIAMMEMQHTHLYDIVLLLCRFVAFLSKTFFVLLCYLLTRLGYDIRKSGHSTAAVSGIMIPPFSAIARYPSRSAWKVNNWSVDRRNSKNTAQGVRVK